MAIVIETTDDFIRVLRQNEEFKAAARRELLTDDLLELPGEFREFRTYAEENFVNVNELREFREQTEQRFDGVDERFDGVDLSMRNLTNSVNDLRGSALEAKLPTRLRQRAARTLGLTRPRTLWSAEHYVQPPSRAEAFDGRKERAADNGQISYEEADRLTDTDMIMSAETTDGETVYIAVEASGVIGGGDISRARQSADILKRLYDAEAIPAVYGFSIAPEQVEQAKPKDGLVEVHIFLDTERY